MLRSTVSHYRLIEQLGTGGMGELWVAEDEMLLRRVALKAIRAERRLDPSSRERFLREAQILSQLDHPSICRIHDYLIEEDQDYLVLELIEGEELRATVARGVERAEVLDILEQVNAALVAAHAEGIVHRDLKPANVMRTPEGAIKVLDFGLSVSTGRARAEAPEGAANGGSDRSTGELTEAGSIVGTLRYMSPEQARGEPAEPPSDMYALGLLVVELLVGRSPFPGTLDVDKLLEVAREGAKVPDEIRKKELGRLCARLLDPAPTRRPTAVEIAERVRWIRERPRRVGRRVAVGAALGAGFVGLVKYTVDLGASRDRAEAARRGAEGLVDFMHGNLHERLRSVGQLAALGETADRTLEYLESRRTATLDGDDSARRARALLRIGEVRFEQGEREAALAFFEESLGLAERLRELDPADADRTLLCSEAEYWVGFVHLSSADYAAAEASFLRYLAIAEELVAREPDDPRFRMELAYAHTNMAAIHMGRGDEAAALDATARALDIKRELYDENPADPERRRTLANGLSWMGGALDGAGDVEGARRIQEEELEIRRSQSQEDPDNADLRSLLSISLQRMANLLQRSGEVRLAIDLYREDVRNARELLALDPTNAAWRRDLAVSRHTLAKALLGRGAVDEAERFNRACRAGLEPLLELDPENPDYLAILARSFRLECEIELERGHPTEALVAADAGLNVFPGESGAAAPSAERAHVERGLWQQRAEACRRIGDREGAEESLARAASLARAIGSN